MPSLPSIVVVGGGFAGFNAAAAAVRAGGGRVDVTLVARDRWMCIRPRLYERDPATLRTDIATPLATIGVHLIEAEALGIDGGRLALASGSQLPFDRLIAATGSVMKRPEIIGVDNASSIDDWQSAMAFDARLSVAAARPRPPKIVIIGAGFTGLELALEMRDRIAAHATAAHADAAEICLIDIAQHVGAELGAGPRPHIIAALAAARIGVYLGRRPVAISADRILLETGESIDCDLAVVCTGLVAAPFVSTLAGIKDAAGRCRVDQHLRAASNIFVAGDAACASPEPGRETLMSCQHALRLGRTAGENAARDILGEPLLAYAQPRYVTCLDLGRSGAVFSQGWDRIPHATGTEAKAIKTEINTRRIYPATGSRADILAASSIV